MRQSDMRGSTACWQDLRAHDFLVRVMKIETVPGEFAGTVTSRLMFRVRELRRERQPRTLLGMVKRTQLKEMNEAEACCGFGSTFAVKFGEISTRIADNKCDHIAKCKADAIVLVIWAVC
jgi:L-lactate dehydrogenase complex protein LldE